MMTLPKKEDAIHKAWLYRLLEAIADDHELSQSLYFKGGTCASMLGWLPRFSVDLDFDYALKGNDKDIRETRGRLEKIFKELGLSIKDSSKNGIQYFLKYDNPVKSARNTLKIDVSFPIFKSSKYAPKRFEEIDRILTCQTRETMFAHKLVAPLDRYEKTGSIAGRDIFDIRHFFLSNFNFDPAVIKECRGVEAKEYLGQLYDFVEKNVNNNVITEDLSSLLPPADFQRVRKILKREVLSLLKEANQQVN